MDQRRRGFALIYVIVLTAVVAALFAVAAPALIADEHAQRAAATITILQEIAHGDSAYFTSDGSYPYRVAELSQPVVRNNAAYTNSCGGANTLASSDVTAWNNLGPYVPFYANANTADALWTPVGYINDTLIRNPATNKAGFHEIQINGVTSADAATIDADVDGSVNGAAGTIQYGTAVNDTLTLTYWVPIGGKC